MKIGISGLMYVTGVTVTGVTVTGVTFLMDNTSEDQYIKSYVCHWCYCHWCYCSVNQSMTTRHFSKVIDVFQSTCSFLLDT